MIFNEPYQNLNVKIDDLGRSIRDRTDLFSSFSYEAWEKIFELAANIQERFKGIQYPTKKERDDAWDRFCLLRNEAYETKRDQLMRLSKEHRNRLWSNLEAIQYSKIIDDNWGAFSLGLVSLTVNEMKVFGRRLKDLGQEFSSAKREMIGEHKKEIFEKIQTVRESHDRFWVRYKEICEQQSRKYEQRRAENAENSRRIKEKIQENLRKNEENLRKAEDELDRISKNNSKLERDIYDSTIPHAAKF